MVSYINQCVFSILCIDEDLLANKTRKNIEVQEDAVHRRSKRETIFQGAQSYPRYVEVMVTADKSMLDHHGSEFELKRYIQTVMGVVSHFLIYLMELKFLA